MPSAARNFLSHLHRCGQVPLIANLSSVFLHPKGNSKPGLLSQRLLHLYCHFWRLFYGSRLRTEVKLAGTRWDSFSHAYLPCRSREGAMASQNAVQYKLADANLQSIGHLRDMANAFASTKNGPRTETVHELIPDGASPYELGKVGYRFLFMQKLTASGIRMTAADGRVLIVCPLTGNVVGSSEGPTLFSHSYNKHLNIWLESR